MKGYGYTPSAEAIYEAEADLVIVKDPASAADLRAVGITAITFTYGNSEELVKAVKMLGDVFGGEAKTFANKWTAYYNDTVDFIKDKLGISLSNSYVVKREQANFGFSIRYRIYFFV